MRFERPGFSFLEAVGMALKIMVIIGLVIGDGFFIYWLHTNGHVMWSYITGTLSFFVFLVCIFWDWEF
ncbi:hypothetical protein ES968_22185 (plasmid) [Bacillus subtilis]|uniref:hypothetical protein n=1 Tax=Bacillus subtilis TaxID=1423 RepID=UPI00100A058A|nr:hypothetical protein [Bacillus subtilis]QAW06673.1 hypothetical protein ES968_22185 [Bacillus subtilis]